MTYPLCYQTVTIYRLSGAEVQRRVARDCFFRREDQIHRDTEGLRRERSFLLIQPGENPIYPGDRIYEGEGPAVTREEWPAFTPENEPRLVVASRATPHRWQGSICHYEAE
jgi:hypothetical protein